MKRAEKITAFLDYGGNELFSTLMGDNINRSEGVDRLTELLCIYSDICPLINGRSKAYRFMLFRAKAKAWLGVHSNDLKSHKLTSADRARVEELTAEYIQSGGIYKKSAKKLLFALAVLFMIVLLFFIVYKHMSSKEYGDRLLNYYAEQVIIEYEGKKGENLSFKIHTGENAPLFMYMKRMPRVYYYITEEEELLLDIKCEYDISSEDDKRADYTSLAETLTLYHREYGTEFFPGKYRVEFEFYFYNEELERIDLPVIKREITIN